MTARVWRALAIIAVLVAACIAGDLVFGGNRTELGQEAWQAFAPEAGTLEGELGSGDGLVGEGGTAALPEGFEEEALSLEGYREVRVGADGTVIGFVTEGSAEDVLRVLGGKLEERGWAACETGTGNSAAFVKQSGRFTWLFVSATQMGDTASVVIWCDGGTR